MIRAPRGWVLRVQAGLDLRAIEKAVLVPIHAEAPATVARDDREGQLIRRRGQCQQRRQRMHFSLAVRLEPVHEPVIDPSSVLARLGPTYDKVRAVTRRFGD